MITYDNPSLYKSDRNRDNIFIYLLMDQGKPFYVGSTVNPCLRYLEHLDLKTKNTRYRISQMVEADRTLEMRIVDLTSKEGRIYLEAKHINETPGVLNHERYPKHYLDYLLGPEHSLKLKPDSQGATQTN